MTSLSVFNPLFARSPRDKVAGLTPWVQLVLGGAHQNLPRRLLIPETTPGRDIDVVPIRALPTRPGLSYVEGQARLLHDLANIELQAMELAFRTLIEFGHQGRAFAEELATIVHDEGRHLLLCIEGLETIGFPWGTWPVHLSLWNCVRADDSILDRILMVHRYQEGGGLDAGERMLQKISGVNAPVVREILETIFREELGHVQFGSRWYRHFCAEVGLNPTTDFKERLAGLIARMPVRKERISRELRLKAGFSEGELDALEAVQRKQSFSDRKVIHDT